MSQLSALALCGIEPDAVYLSVVERLREASIVPPGRHEPSQFGVAEAYSPVQRMRHYTKRPPAFEDLDEADSRESFEDIARTLPFPLASIQPQLAPDVEAAIKHIVDLGPGRISDWRFSQRALIRQCAALLEHTSARIRALRPPHVAWTGRPHVNIAFVCALVDAIDWPDKSFPKEQFVTGAPLVGELTRTGLFRPKSFVRLRSERRKLTPLRNFYRDNAKESGRLKRIVEKRANAATGCPDKEKQIQDVYDLSIEEVKAGTAKGPFPYSFLKSTFGYGNFRPLIRSAVYRGDKGRAVDNGRDIAKAALDPEILGMMHPTFPAAVANRFYELITAKFPGLKWRLGASKDDEKAAYKSTPTSTPQFTAALTTDPISKKKQ